MGRIRHTATIVVMSFAMLTASCAAADPDASGPKERNGITNLRDDYGLPPWPEPPNAGGLLLRLAIGTCVALAVCAGSLWFGRRWLRGNLVAAGPGGQLQVLESIALGNRCFVHLLQAGKAHVLAGTDSAGLRVLMAVPTPFTDFLAARIERPLERERSTTADEVLVQ